MQEVLVMLKSERKQIILERINQQQFVRLEELMEVLNTSESTVRRDLDELETARKLRRVHGGAEAPVHLQLEESILEKSVKNVQEKRTIAEKAVEQIKNGEVIFLDAGTTTGLMIDFLHQDKLTVVTNSIHHAVRLVEKNIKTVIVGGFVKESTDASIGAVALEQIRQLNFEKAFLGMNGIDKNYLTTPDIEEATIKRTVIENAKDAYILVDSSKIGQFSFVKVAEVESATIICQPSDSSLLDIIKEKTRVIEV